MGAILDIVEPDDAQPAGADRAADLGATGQKPQRHLIVEAERGVDLGMILGQQPGHGAPHAAARPARQDKGRQPRARQRRAVARQPFFRHHPALQPADKGDVSRAFRDQVFGRKTAARRVIGRGKGEKIGAPVHPAQHLHRGQTGAGDGVKARLPPAIGGRDDQGGNTMFDHRPDHLRLKRGGFVRIGQNRREAAFRQRHLKRDGEFGEEGVAQVVDDKPDQPGAGASEVGGRAVIDIAQRLHRRADGGAGFRAHRGAVLQDKADGRFRHARRPRHVDDGGPALHPPTLRPPSQAGRRQGYRPARRPHCRPAARPACDARGGPDRPPAPPSR